MNWSNIFSKVKHAVVPAVGAAALVALGMVTGGTVPAAVVVKAAVGAFIGYLIKPPRPEVEPAKS